MTPNSNNNSFINGLNTKTKHKQDPPLWKFKGLNLTTNPEKSYSVSIADFIHDKSDSVLGPGAGAGVGCGVGFGFGLVGGLGVGGSAWNHVRVAFGFGFGVGCGVGAGFGYGQGFGYGSRWETLKTRIGKPSPGSKKGF